jgi:hypothetical protein
MCLCKAGVCDEYFSLRSVPLHGTRHYLGRNYSDRITVTVHSTTRLLRGAMVRKSVRQDGSTVTVRSAVRLFLGGVVHYPCGRMARSAGRLLNALSP